MNTYTPPRVRDWYEHYHNLYLLIAYLVEEQGYTAEQIVKVLESPWKWANEYTEACDLY